MVRDIFPMYRMTIDGLTSAIDDLRVPVERPINAIY